MTSNRITYKPGDICLHSEQSLKYHHNGDRDYFAILQIGSPKCPNCLAEPCVNCTKKHTTSVKTVNLTSGLVQNLPTSSLIPVSLEAIINPQFYINL